MNRRRFLGSAALASVFGKPAADAAMAQAGLGTKIGDMTFTPGRLVGGLGGGELANRVNYLRGRSNLFGRLFKVMPAWERRNLSDDARVRARRFDPDIASLRSVSIAGKYNMQRRREYDRAIEERYGWPERELSELLWKQENGFE